MPRLSRRALLLAGSALALAGCGGASSQGNGGASLTVWYETGLPIAPALQAAVARYNATRPAVPAVAEPQPDLSVKLLVVIGAHDAPDVVIYPRSRAWPLASRGAAFPLTDFARRDGITGAAFSPGAWAGGTANGQLWGLPIGADADILAYNAKLLAAAGVQPAPYWSSSAFEAACAALVRRDAKQHLTQTGAVLARQVPFPVWLWQQGADVLTTDGKAPAFDGPAGLKAIQWLLADQQTNGGAPEIGRLVSLTTLTEGVTGVFTHEKLGMLPTNYAGFVRLKRQSPSLPLRLATLPTLDGGRPSTMLDVVYAFSPQQSANPHPEGTWQFLKWLATDVDTQLKLFAAGSMPTLLAAQRHPAVSGDADAKVMLAALQVARNPQDFPAAPQVAAALDVAVQPALDGRATPQHALDDARAQAERLLQEENALAR